MLAEMSLGTCYFCIRTCLQAVSISEICDKKVLSCSRSASVPYVSVFIDGAYCADVLNLIRLQIWVRQGSLTRHTLQHLDNAMAMRRKPQSEV